MVFGLGTKKKEPVKSSKKDVKSQSGKSAQANEAAELLKKMEEKKASGDCPFC